MSKTGSICLPGDDFGRDQITIDWFEILSEDEDGDIPRLRMFLPRQSQLLSIAAPFINAHLYQAHKGTEEERRESMETLELGRLFTLVGNLLKRRDRKLNWQHLERTEWFRQLLQHGAPGLERGPAIMKMAGPVLHPTIELIRGAIYVHGDPGRPSEISYYDRFRSNFLNGLTESRWKIIGAFDAALNEVLATVGASSSPSEEKVTSFGLLREMQDPDNPIREREIKEAEKASFLKSWKQESKVHKAFEDIVSEAEAIAEGPFSRFLEVLTSVGGNEDAADVAKKQAIESRLDVARADAVFRRSVERYEKVFGVTPLDNPEILFLKTGEQTRSDDEPGPHFGNYLWMWAALKSDDKTAKWNQLCWIISNLRNRQDMVRCLLFEAEDVHNRSYEYGMQLIYRKLLPYMNRGERRLFGLLHFRLPALDYQPPILQAPIRAFWEMDAETRALILLCLVLKHPEFSGEAAEVLRTRWRAQLRLHPFLLEQLQENEAEEKATSRRWKTHTPLYEGEGRIRSQKKGSEELRTLDDDPVERPLYEQLVDHCRNSTHKEWLLLLAEGYSQEEVADHADVTQQAVSKALSSATEAFKKHLKSEN